LNSLWVFILGNYYGKKVKEGSSLPEFLVCFVIFFLVVKLLPVLAIFLPSQLMLYAAEGLVVMVVAAFILKYLHCGILCGFLRWFGTRSLELYLTNLFLIKAQVYFGFSELAVGAGEYLQYGVILAIGIVLTMVLFPLENKLVKTIIYRS